MIKNERQYKITRAQAGRKGIIALDLGELE